MQRIVELWTLCRLFAVPKMIKPFTKTQWNGSWKQGFCVFWFRTFMNISLSETIGDRKFFLSLLVTKLAVDPASPVFGISLLCTFFTAYVILLKIKSAYVIFYHCIFFLFVIISYGTNKLWAWWQATCLYVTVAMPVFK